MILKEKILVNRGWSWTISQECVPAIPENKSLGCCEWSIHMVFQTLSHLEKAMPFLKWPRRRSISLIEGIIYMGGKTVTGDMLWCNQEMLSFIINELEDNLISEHVINLGETKPVERSNWHSGISSGLSCRGCGHVAWFALTMSLQLSCHSSEEVT